MRRQPFAVITLIILLAATSRAFAWGTKEHVQLTRIAANRLIADPSTPPAMKKWLEQNTPGPRDMAAERAYLLHTRIGIVPRAVDGLPYWSVMPDLMINIEPNVKVEPYGVPERLLHYIDLEFFVPDETRRDYRHDLSGKPKLADIARDMKDKRYERAGMLPFRVDECYRKLVASIRANRLSDQPGQFPRDDHAAKWAGYLAHYVADNTQPQHATIDYQSQKYFADKRSAPKIHFEVEFRLVDDEHADFPATRELYWTAFEAALKTVDDPVNNDDVWRATCEVSLKSYDALPLIGLAAMHAAKQAGTPEKPEGAAAEKFDTEAFFRFKGSYLGREMTLAEMKAHQQAWAVKRIERLWRKAWDEANAKH
ncbi:MAG: hypothetical protein M3478_03015 [Planctomycetota bacterium]|nr:hypothetical protein [Planctomycetota bacterium]